MHTHQDTITAISQHIPADDIERTHIASVIQFINNTPKAFERDHEAGGHVGATAIVISSDCQHILLTHHKVENTWAFFGNHCEGNSNLVEVARQRISKDAGTALANLCKTNSFILDVDVHHVPAHQRGNTAVPEHLHYDIAYLFTTSELAPPQGTSRWFTLAEAASLPRRDAQFKRILAKISQ
jgi:hypothetical protein